MYKFVYDIPTKVYFGEDQLGNLSRELSAFGKNILLVYGDGSIKKNGLYDKVKAELDKSGFQLYECGGVASNPRIDSVREGARICKEQGVDAILAIGGGSVIDAGKMIAAGACVDFDPWDFLEKKAPMEKALPLAVILTIAATGSEMDGTSVISNPDTKDKTARTSPLMIPKVSFMDPSLTCSVGTYQTACGAADILSHVMEVYFNMEPGLYMLDCFMEGLMKTVIRFAPVALKDPDNLEARANLMWASSWAINGFIRGGRVQSWSCHPIEHELSAVYDITHGLGLAILTPRWMKYCLDQRTVSKYVQFATEVFGVDPQMEPMAAAKEGIRRLEDFLFKTMGLARSLREIGIDDRDFDVIAEKSSKSLKKAFRPIDAGDVKKILEMCLDSDDV